MHICHFNSSSKTDVERCARLVAKAQEQGLPITLEAYPYVTGSTVLAAAFFSDPEFETRNGIGYDSVQRVTDGRRFRNREELLAAQAEEPSTLVLWHILDTENNERHRGLLDISVLFPGGAIASDAMPWSLADGTTYTGDAWPLPEDATSHPRSAGAFTRFLRHWVRERQAISRPNAKAERPDERRGEKIVHEPGVECAEIPRQCLCRDAAAFACDQRSRIPRDTVQPRTTLGGRRVTVASRAGAAISGDSHPGVQSAGNPHWPPPAVLAGAPRCASSRSGPSMTKVSRRNTSKTSSRLRDRATIGLASRPTCSRHWT